MNNEEILLLNDRINDALYYKYNKDYDKIDVILKLMSTKNIYNDKLNNVISEIYEMKEILKHHYLYEYIFNAIILVHNYELNDLKDKEIALLSVIIDIEPISSYKSYINIIDSKILNILKTFGEYRSEYIAYPLSKYLDKYYDDIPIENLSLDQTKFLSNKIYEFLNSHHYLEFDYTKYDDKLIVDTVKKVSF